MHYVIEYHLLSVTEISVSVVDHQKKDFAKAVDLQMFSTNSLDTISCYALQSQQLTTWLLLFVNTPLHGTLHN